jgi:hypothetical protein
MPRKEPAEVHTASRDKLAEARSTSEAAEVAYPTLHLPPFTPRAAAAWFSFAQRYFAATKVNNDMVKFTVVLAHLTDREQERVEDIMANPMVDYTMLKSEVLKRFTESNNARIHRLLESEEIGDRTPSEFYRHLRKLVTPDVSEKMVLTL